MNMIISTSWTRTNQLTSYILLYVLAKWRDFTLFNIFRNEQFTLTNRLFDMSAYRSLEYLSWTFCSLSFFTITLPGHKHCCPAWRADRLTPAAEYGLAHKIQPEWFYIVHTSYIDKNSWCNNAPTTLKKVPTYISQLVINRYIN